MVIINRRIELNITQFTDCISSQVENTQKATLPYKGVPHYWSFVWAIHQSPGYHITSHRCIPLPQRVSNGGLMFYLISSWKSCWKTIAFQVIVVPMWYQCYSCDNTITAAKINFLMNAPVHPIVSLFHKTTENDFLCGCRLLVSRAPPLKTRINSNHVIDK